MTTRKLLCFEFSVQWGPVGLHWEKLTGYDPKILERNIKNRV